MRFGDGGHENRNIDLGHDHAVRAGSSEPLRFLDKTFVTQDNGAPREILYGGNVGLRNLCCDEAGHRRKEHRPRARFQPIHFAFGNERYPDVLSLRCEGKDPHGVEGLEVVIREGVAAQLQIGAFECGHPGVGAAFRQWKRKNVLRGWIKADGHPGKVGAAFRDREQERSLGDSEMPSKDPERSSGGETLSGSREIMLDRREDVLRLNRRGLVLAGGEKRVYRFFFSVMSGANAAESSSAPCIGSGLCSSCDSMTR